MLPTPLSPSRTASHNARRARLPYQLQLLTPRFLLQLDRDHDKYHKWVRHHRLEQTVVATLPAGGKGLELPSVGACLPERDDGRPEGGGPGDAQCFGQQRLQPLELDAVVQVHLSRPMRGH